MLFNSAWRVYPQAPRSGGWKLAGAGALGVEWRVDHDRRPQQQQSFNKGSMEEGGTPHTQPQRQRSEGSEAKETDIGSDTEADAAGMDDVTSDADAAGWIELRSSHVLELELPRLSPRDTSAHLRPSKPSNESSTDSDEAESQLPPTGDELRRIKSMGNIYALEVRKGPGVT